jgi:Protein of unknown function (DUF1593)
MRTFTGVGALLIVAMALAGPSAHAQSARSAAAVSDKPRLIVLTDIGNEPDDSMSMVRLLTYANELDIEGLVATTSTHLRTETHREMIERRATAYGEALPNLRVHARGFPDASQLMSRVRSGSAAYGMSGVGDGKETEASRLIVEAVDRPDSRPVWVTIWGGAADLAQALWTVRATRSPAEVERFVSKLRVYSISDQDDAGPWARANFPALFWIASIHGFSDYLLSTWIGINDSSADRTQVTQAWLDEHIRSHGPLGAAYPRVVFGMEGDTPSFLYLIPNGLGVAEHPNWGSWGGRYDQVADFLGLWTDATDRVIGADGQAIAGVQVTVSRWRGAYQNDFAARMDWSVTPRYADANHPPQVRLNGVAGIAVVEIAACAGDVVRLSARGTSDPDRQRLTYRWWQYREAVGPIGAGVQLSVTEGPETTAVAQLPVQRSDLPLPEALAAHVILEVTDSGAPALTRYRRAVIKVLTGGAHAGRQCPAPVIRAPVHFTDDDVDVGVVTGGALSVARSSVGELIGNPAARAILDRHLPGFASTPGLAQAPMPLRLLQGYLPAMTDEVLAAIDADLAKLPQD